MCLCLCCRSYHMKPNWQPLLPQSALWGGLICANGVLWFLLQPDMLLRQPVIDYCCPQQYFFNAAWWCLMADNRHSPRQTRFFPHIARALFVVNGAPVAWQIKKLAREAVHIVFMHICCYYNHQCVFFFKACTLEQEMRLFITSE